jgi:DNA-binding NtrC family response regulator
VIDDEEAYRFLLTAIAEDAGWRATGAADAAQARGVLAREPVDCVLLDVSLRGEDGLAFLAELTANEPNVAVVLVTGHHDAELDREALAAGARVVVRKPFVAQDVRAALELVL